jgi:hypothetical protein
MAQDMKTLVAFGFNPNDPKSCTHNFLTEDVDITVPTLADDYWWTFLARIKTIAVNVGKAPRTPWEILLWGDVAAIENIPETCHVPIEYISSNINAREALWSL